MLDGVVLLWFVLTAAALLFVAVDIRTTPESPVLKWGFVLLTAYTGVIGARGLHLRLSHELVAGGAPSQARHDDGAPGRCDCRRARRHGG